MKQIIISDNWTKEPATDHIFGNFIESGFGRQVTGMWSEMLYNRAFRHVDGYKKATWEWLGLDREHYNSQAPFWHSGYEENNWEMIGEPVAVHSCGTYTYKGLSSYLLENKEEGRLCGLKQRGVYLEKGREYVFRIFAGVRGSMGKAGINGFGDTNYTEENRKMTIHIGTMEKSFLLTTLCGEYCWKFLWEKQEKDIKVQQNDENDIQERCKGTQEEVQITFRFAGTLILAYASLMPADNLNGWRKDVVESLKEVAPSVVRFPGGCFVSFYNWESSIGNRNVREPQSSYFWGGLEENDVGLDEFLALSKLVGFEPQICFNMMTSTPFKARQLVEYLNASEQEGMGRLRMLNGQKEPYGVRLFEMDNEPGRKWSAKQYAVQCVAYAREMRLADSSIELMMAAYAYAPELLPMMLEIAGKEIDYVIYRQGNPDFVAKVMAIIRDYNQKHHTRIKMANTEWLPSCYSIEPFEDSQVPTDYTWHAAIENDYRKIFSTQQMSWNYALNGAHRLLDYISYGGEFAIANFNNMCNTWGQNVIEASKEGCYLSCMGKIFAFFHRVFEVCTASSIIWQDTDGTECDADGLFALAVKSEREGRMQLYLINHTTTSKTVKLPEGQWKCIDGLAGIGRLAREKQSEKCVFPCICQPDEDILTVKPLTVLCLTQI